MRKIAVEDAIGRRLCHDVARIIIGEVKDTPFRRGHVITAADVPQLLALGKAHVYVEEPGDDQLMHEEDVARALYGLCAGPSLVPTPVNQGKIEAVANMDGMLKVNVPLLHAVNSIGQLTVVTRWTHTFVKTGDVVAGMRCIPLWLNRAEVEAAQRCCEGQGPLLEVLPICRTRVGLVVTGTEVFEGRIRDAFTPIIAKRIAPYGLDIVERREVPDDTETIVAAIQDMRDAGADIIFCTGGMSVDPDDLTPGAIRQWAGSVVTYGLPVLPGSMVCIAYHEDGTPVVGLPGGVLFSQPTAFDRLLPRLITGDRISKEDCIAMGHGGLMS